MNKRFIFRVWDSRDKEYFDYVWFVNNCETVYNDMEYCGRQYNSAKDKIEVVSQRYFLEQCTGLSAAKSYRGDKPDDLLIYEGDILQKIVGKWFEISNSVDISDLEILRENKLIILEREKDGFIEVVCRDKTDAATMNRFPVYWLEREEFGDEGEKLEDPSDWEIIGNIHEVEK